MPLFLFFVFSFFCLFSSFASSLLRIDDVPLVFLMHALDVDKLRILTVLVTCSPGPVACSLGPVVGPMVSAGLGVDFLLCS